MSTACFIVLLISACHITSFLTRVSHFIKLSGFKLVMLPWGNILSFEAWSILKPIHGISAYNIWRFSTQLVNNKLSKACCIHDIVMCEVDAFNQSDSLCTNYRDSPLEATRGLVSCSKAQRWQGVCDAPCFTGHPPHSFLLVFTNNVCLQFYVTQEIPTWIPSKTVARAQY